MGFKFNALNPTGDPEGDDDMAQPLATEDLFLDSKGKVIKSGKAAVQLLARKGQAIPPGFDAPKPKATKSRKDAEDK